MGVLKRAVEGILRLLTGTSKEVLSTHFMASTVVALDFKLDMDQYWPNVFPLFFKFIFQEK